MPSRDPLSYTPDRHKGQEGEAVDAGPLTPPHVGQTDKRNAKGERPKAKKRKGFVPAEEPREGEY